MNKLVGPNVFELDFTWTFQGTQTARKEILFLQFPQKRDTKI